MKNKVIKMKTAAITRADNIHRLIRDICADPELWDEVISGAVDCAINRDDPDDWDVLEAWGAVRQRLADTDTDERKKIADSICQYLRDIPGWVHETEGCVIGLTIDAMDEMGLMIMAAP